MRRIILTLMLIIALGTTPVITSCGGEGGLVGLSLFGTVIVIGVIAWAVTSGMSDTALDIVYPPDDSSLLSRESRLNVIENSINTSVDHDWYKTILHEGDVLTVWSESNDGVKALLFDETGTYCRSDNLEPDSDFRIEIQAIKDTTLLLMVYNEYMEGPTDYELHWSYGR